MKAAIITGPKQIKVEKMPVPDCPDNYIRVKLLKVALCGSDFPYFFNEYSADTYPLPPGYPGHECLGIVDKSNNSLFSEGELVMFYPPFLDGFKEYHITPPERLQKLPQNYDLNVLLMTQLLGAVSHCAFRIDKPYNKNVVIMGQGPVGLLFTSLMKNFGAKNIITVDPLQYRLEKSKVMGATHTINPNNNNLVEFIKDITANEMADIVIDAYGQDVNVINKCFDVAKHNGQVAFFGICLEESPKLNFNVFFRKELRMIASVGPNINIDYPFALDMILKGAIDVKPLITHEMPFEKIQDGFELAISKKEDVIKVILNF